MPTAGRMMNAGRSITGATRETTTSAGTVSRTVSGLSIEKPVAAGMVTVSEVAECRCTVPAD